MHYYRSDAAVCDSLIMLFRSHFFTTAYVDSGTVRVRAQAEIGMLPTRPLSFLFLFLFADPSRVFLSAAEHSQSFMIGLSDDVDFLTRPTSTRNARAIALIPIASVPGTPWSPLHPPCDFL